MGIAFRKKMAHANSHAGKTKSPSSRSNNQISSTENPFTQKAGFVSLADALGTLNRKGKK